MQNLAVIPYNPLAGGLLTGRYDPANTPATGRFSQEIGRFGTMYQQRYWHDAAFTIVEGARTAAVEHGVSLATLAIGWMLANPAVTSAIIGASRAEQLVDTLEASDLDVSSELKDRLDRMSDHRTAPGR
jgi:aryl-alcohol dehydrogenase-like predicted oxidoreductase